jgi:diaminohydroxyphosphoribosylaminopyrimidine deaminase/5-amino-6-(5-phosphoribosylamino)uracil reductase
MSPESSLSRFSVQDHHWMQRALELASLGCWTVSPNPAVGCVYVRDNLCVGEGYHQRAGEGHAEVKALENAGGSGYIRGATAYVTLEPCSHCGKTPPCADLLIKEGVVRVVIAMQDPNPLVAGQGLARLKQAGLQVEVGLLASQAESLNPGFVKRMRSGLPYVYLKIAASLDGKTALHNGKSQWITGAQARQDGHVLRAGMDAIVTGVQTVLSDDCALTVRGVECPASWKAPQRWVLDGQLRIPLSAKILDTQQAPTCIFTGETAHHAQPDKVNQLQQRGCRVVVLPVDTMGRICLEALMSYASECTFNQLLIEAGPRLSGAFVEGNWVDEWHFYQAPTVLGPEGADLMTLRPIDQLSDALRWQWIETQQLGVDLKHRLKRSV